MSRRKRLSRYQPMSRWSPKIALGRTVRRIDEAKEAIADISATWGDVDQFIVDRVEEIFRELEELATEIRTAVEERLAAGEYVGL